MLLVFVPRITMLSNLRKISWKLNVSDNGVREVLHTTYQDTSTVRLN